MILFHGTNTDIDKINLTIGQKHKDFGQGFYLTPDKDTATRMAMKKSRLFGGAATVIAYDFDENLLNNSSFKILVFPEKATAEWIKFISLNRDTKEQVNCHGLDIIKGPIADDGVVLQLTNFRDQILTPEEAAKRMQDKFLDQQLCFCTEKAISVLKKIDSWKIH